MLFFPLALGDARFIRLTCFGNFSWRGQCSQVFTFPCLSLLSIVSFRNHFKDLPSRLPLKNGGKKTPALVREAIGFAKLLQNFRIHQMFFEKFFKNLKNFFFYSRTLRFFLVCGCKVISFFWTDQTFCKIILKKIENSFATPLRSPQRAIEPIAKFLALSVRCSANTSHHVLYLYYINSALKLFLKS